MALSSRQILIIMGIGLGIISSYILYLTIRVGCMKRDDETVPPPSAPHVDPNPELLHKSMATQPELQNKVEKNASTEQPALEKDAGKYANQLLKTLLDNVNQIPGADKQYKHRVIREIYRKFKKLNQKLETHKVTLKSRKFLEDLKRRINKYEQQGGNKSEQQESNIPYKKIENTVKEILDSQAELIYKVFPALKY